MVKPPRRERGIVGTRADVAIPDPPQPAPDRHPEVGDFADEVEIPVMSELIGRWVTSFDLLFPSGNDFDRGAILACFNLKNDGTFDLERRRTLEGAMDVVSVGGHYRADFHPVLGVVAGEIIIVFPNGGSTTLHFFLRDRNEMRWIMVAPEGTSPIAQGVMNRVTLVKDA